MYLESISALEDTVRATSASEMQEVEASIHAILHGTTAVTEQLRSFLYNPEVTSSDTNASQWSRSSRTFCFSMINGDSNGYGAGVVLIPYNETDNSAFYSAVWADPVKTNGVSGREFVHATYTEANTSAFVVEEEKLVQMLVETNLVVDGLLEGYLYEWDGKSYLTDLLKEWDPRDGGLPADDAIQQNTWRSPDRFDAVAVKWRPPRSWFSRDNTVYTYSSYDAVYIPPPPPHPWSGYKAVLMISQFLYSSWEKVILEHKESREDSDTTVVLVDTTTAIVYASTTGDSLFNDACYASSLNSTDAFNVTSPFSCATTIHNMSETVQEAFFELTSRPGEGDLFMKASLGDAGEHFLRRGALHENVIILWLRPTSSVQGKVDNALRLFILFTTLIFVFDIILACVEIWWIALPMKRLSEAIVHVGRMDTLDALQKIKRYQKYKILLKEVRILMEGMTVTIARISEYKAFMPEAVLISDASFITLSPPCGNISVVFTDIVRSTELWEAAPEAMAISMDIHNKVIRQKIAKYGGYEVKTIGDAFMVTFEQPLEAVQFCCDVQVSLLHEPWPAEILLHPQAEELYAKDKILYRGLSLRMGVHIGNASLEANPVTTRSDYRGATVNKAARLENQALSGMIVISSEFHNEIRGLRADLSSSSLVFSIHTLGVRTLKGIGECELFYVTPDCLKERAQVYKNLAHPKMQRRNGTDRLHAVVDMDRGGGSESPRSHRSHIPRSMTSRASLKTACPDDFERRLRKSDAAVAVIKMNRVLNFTLDTEEPPLMMYLLNTTFEIVNDACNMTEGKVAAFTGTTVVISWNCAVSCASYAVQSLRFCGALWKKGVEVHVGVACGTIYHGFTGSSSRRYHTVLGPAVRYAELLSNAVCNEKPNVAFSGRFVNSLRTRGAEPLYSHCIVPIDVWEGHRDFGAYVVVEKVLGKAAAELRVRFEDDVSDRVGDPAAMLRAAVLLSASQEGPGGGAGGAPLQDVLAMSDLPEEVRRAATTLAAKPVLVTDRRLCVPCLAPLEIPRGNSLTTVSDMERSLTLNPLVGMTKMQ